MSEAGRISNISQDGFHPVSHYDSPDDVVSDAKLSAAEKRAILSSWASDMCAVESNPRASRYSRHVAAVAAH